MVTDEDMAVSFFTKGDASHLARELTTILQSSELQRSMAEHNFAAGVQMTMGSVVRSYLRWFELKKCQNEIASRTASPWRLRVRSLFSKSGKGSSPEVFAGAANRMEHRQRNAPTGNRALSPEFASPLTWRKSESLADSAETDRYPAGPTLESEL
jgi:hypothetical protein